MLEKCIHACKIYIFTSIVINTNMYVLIINNKALIIDPHISEEALELLRRNSVSEVTILLTHEHPDHTCGVPVLVDKFSTTLICHRRCSEIISDKRHNRPLIMSIKLAEYDKMHNTNLAKTLIERIGEYECLADIVFDDEFYYTWEDNEFKFIATPGHSKGSCCIFWNEKVMFSGDSLILDAEIITRFPGGSVEDYVDVTLPFLKNLDDDLLILSGHGEIFTIGQSSIKNKLFS